MKRETWFVAGTLLGILFALGIYLIIYVIVNGFIQALLHAF